MSGGFQYFILNVKGLKVDGERYLLSVGRFGVGGLKHVDGQCRVVTSVFC